MSNGFSRRQLGLLVAGLGASAGLGRAYAKGKDVLQGHAIVADGIAIYLGVIPSAMIARGYAMSAPEHMMHGGPPPKGVHYHHVMVALYDNSTGKRITDAKVTATVRPLGLGGTTKAMAPFMLAGAMTYCNYFDMPENGVYRIDLQIERPGKAPVKAELQYTHVAGN